MKTEAKVAIILVSIMMTFGIGCSKSKKASAPYTSTYTPFDGVYRPPWDGPGYGPGSNWQYGGTASASIINLSVMSTYTGRPMNNPTSPKINLNLVKYGSGYGGTVTFSYEEGGYIYEGYFTSGTTEHEVQYNIWFSNGGKKAWHGFFEDGMGAIVVVIDGVVDLGDGGGPEDKVSGSMWFKNFGITYAPRPPTRCWFISLGPYDCRTWQSGNGVNTTQAIEPTDGGYQKLATFSGLSLEKAFNGKVTF